MEKNKYILVTQFTLGVNYTNAFISVVNLMNSCPLFVSFPKPNLI